MGFRQAQNVCRIEGLLAETDLKYGSFVKNGETVETVGGTIKVLVEQEINGKKNSLEIPVYLFSTKYTKKGAPNPSYESIEKVMKDFVSIASAGSAAQADKIRITNANIRMNEFRGQDGRIVSIPRIHASFVTKAIGELHPEATFTLEFVVSNISREVDSEGVEVNPPKLNIQAIVPQYTPDSADVMNVDVVPLVATSESVINAVETYWEPGNSYKASGRLNFSSRTEEVIEEVDFGEAQKSVRTTNVSEFVVTGGSQAPLEGDFAWDLDDIRAGMAARKERHTNMLISNAAPRKAPAPTSSKKGKDLGF